MAITRQSDKGGPGAQRAQQKHGAQKYHLERGSEVIDRTDPTTGQPVARSGYGQNQGSLPSSLTNVAAAHKLSDLDITPRDGDAKQDDIAAAAGPRSKPVADAVADLSRTVSGEMYPPAHGHTRRTVDNGSPGGQVPASTGTQSGALPRNNFVK